MYVEVTLPLPITQSFYYRLQGEIPERLWPGQRVLVPFGNRKLTAYVLRTHDQLPTDFPQSAKVKAVLKVLDETSLISDRLFDLSCWVARYYFASLGEVLKACLPPKINPSIKERFRLTSSGEQRLNQTKDTAELGKRKSQILKLLAQHPGVDHRSLEKLAQRRVPAAEVKLLAADDYLQVEQALEPNHTSAQKRWHLELQPHYREALASTSLTANQKALISYLQSAGCSLQLARLRTLFSVSRPALQRLERLGIVLLSQKEAPRDPFRSLTQPCDGKAPVRSREQERALSLLTEALNSRLFSPFLLHGVTGSGKTEVYLSLIERTLSLDKGALVLMPEIGLTPRVAQDFRARLGNTVAILHSALSHGERFDEWWRIKRGEARVVIGTRSAVFAPLDNLGLIVVDEEHDPSYKQQESPRYHARDTSIVLGKNAKAVVVLGSATPSIESFYHSQSGKYGYLRLANRVFSRPLPETRLIDMRADFKTSGKKSILSAELRSAIGARLKKQEQVLILLNRRGYSAYVICRSCGEHIPCRNCSIALTFHRARKALVCHYCNYYQTVPKQCPQCLSEYLYFMGEGTEKVEAIVEEVFPQARVARLDRDTVRRKDAHHQILSNFRQRKIDVLTGTQMISKGHDFPHVTLVGVVSADHTLSFPDFRAAERTFQLLSQVSGRAGRGDLPGHVLIQSYCPEHYCFQFVTSHDYHGFYEKEIQFRRFMHYPPFTAVALILVRDKKINLASEAISRFAELLHKSRSPEIRMLGPTQSPLAMIRSEHRFQILVKSKSRSRLQELLQKALAEAQASGLDLHRIHIDIDPVNVM